MPQARQLHRVVAELSAHQLQSVMGVSDILATKAHQHIADWGQPSTPAAAAIDSFVGDMYSGLQAATFSADHRAYAQTVLKILSGLYGVIRPLDAIWPYRFEMGYRVPGLPGGSLYRYWGDTLAGTLPPDGLVVNASSAEYTKAVLPYIDPQRVVTPQFLTVNRHTGEPGFVVVHAKIARGAFARWLIVQRITKAADVPAFTGLGYAYEPRLSTLEAPVFVCQEFGGLGLSVRLANT